MPLEQRQVFETIRSTLVDQFELDPAAITPDARLHEDLDLDSIDAVDMIISIQDITGCTLRPEDFHQVHTVGDVERVVQRLLAEPSADIAGVGARSHAA